RQAMRRSRIAVLASLAVLLAACSGTPPATEQTGTPSAGTSTGTNASLNRDPSTLVVAVDAFNGDFDPASAYLLSEALIWRGIYESLVRLKGDSATEVEPLLADTWDHNADSSSWTFHLHPAITFSDGTP